MYELLDPENKVQRVRSYDLSIDIALPLLSTLSSAYLWNDVLQILHCEQVLPYTREGASNWIAVHGFGG